jgi:hypothetical protein
MRSFSSLVLDQLVDKAIAEILNEIDLRLKENTISVHNIEAHVSTYVDRMRRKIVEESPPPNPFERLVETTEKFTHIKRPPDYGTIRHNNRSGRSLS